VHRTQVRRRRVGAVIAALAVALGIAFLGGRASAHPDHSAGDRRSQVVVVRGGDTLWSIARHAVGPDGDPRPLIQRIIDRNGIGDGVITVGERLVVPPSR
jgi:hypothetical protein